MTIEFNKYRKFRAYHWQWYEKKPRYRAHVDYLTHWITEKTILDIGAGDGLITAKLKAKGIENDDFAVKLAKKKGADVILGSAYTLPFQDNEFEAVLFGDVIEHLEFPMKALAEAKRVLQKTLYVSGPLPGGVLEAYEYEDSKWTAEQLHANVESLGFRLTEPIKIVGEPRHQFFYAKFEKI